MFITTRAVANPEDPGRAGESSRADNTAEDSFAMILWRRLTKVVRSDDRKANDETPEPPSPGSSLSRVPDDVARSQVANLKSVIASFENHNPLKADVILRKTINQMTDEELTDLEDRLVNDLKGWNPDDEAVRELVATLDTVLGDPNSVPQQWPADLDALLIEVPDQ